MLGSQTATNGSYKRCIYGGTLTLPADTSTLLIRGTCVEVASGVAAPSAPMLSADAFRGLFPCFCFVKDLGGRWLYTGAYEADSSHSGGYCEIAKNVVGEGTFYVVEREGNLVFGWPDVASTAWWGSSKKDYYYYTMYQYS